MKFRIFFFCLIFFFCALVGGHKTFAQNTLEGTFTLEPLFQNIQIEETESSVPVSFVLHNHTNRPQEIEVFALDFQQIDEQGNISFVDKANHNHALASYIRISDPTITLQPNTSASISAEVINSVDLSPGGHYAAVIIRHQQPKVDDQQQVLMGLSSLVFLHKKGGEQYHLSLSRTSLSNTFLSFKLPQHLEYHFSNEGNMQLIPIGKTEIKDMFGRVVAEGLVNDSSRYILPESQKTFIGKIEPRKPLLPISLLTINTFGDNSLRTTPYQQQAVMVYLDWRFVVGVIITVILLFCLVIMLKKRHSKKQ